MSGICGIVSLNADAPTLDQISAMTAVLERRGPDGTHHWLGGVAALGHTSLATTPEACVEQLPFRDEATGCVITADVRLDNREELLSTLVISSETGIVGDGELILRAYLLWGEACLDRLLGDFAFAIWDPRNQRLFCARDHIGMRQLIYTSQPEQIFAFATEPRAILTLPTIPHRVNEGRIADFLEHLEGIDFTSTFFEGICRLPPAHYLTFGAEGLRMQRYWSLVPGPQLKLESNEAYAEAFLEVFREAVRCRLRGAGQVGSMLSGGMDSGAVVAVASRLLAAGGGGPLAIFSAVGPDPQHCKETRTIHAALAMPGLDPHLVDHARLEPYLDDLIRLTRESDEPFDAHMTLLRAVYLAAHRAGMKVVLDGGGGDIVLADGTQIARLLRAGRWRQAWRNLKGERRFWSSSIPVYRRLFRLAGVAILPNWLRRVRAPIGRAIRRIRPDLSSLISPGFARAIGAIDRKEIYRSSSLNQRLSLAEERAHGITHAHLAVGRERYDRVAAAVSIEPRDPFLDIRLLAFCLTLPGDQLIADGWPKVILRRAMAGLVPDAVRWRKGKEHLGWTFTQSLFANWRSCQQGHPALGRYLELNLEANRLDLETVLATPEQVEICYLANWLAHSGKWDRGQIE